MNYIIFINKKVWNNNNIIVKNLHQYHKLNKEHQRNIKLIIVLLHKKEHN